MTTKRAKIDSNTRTGSNHLGIRTNSFILTTNRTSLGPIFTMPIKAHYYPRYIPMDSSPIGEKDHLGHPTWRNKMKRKNKSLLFFIMMGTIMVLALPAFSGAFTSYPGRIMKGFDGLMDQYVHYKGYSDAVNTATDWPWQFEMFFIAPLPRRSSSITDYVDVYVFYYQPENSEKNIRCHTGIGEFSPWYTDDPPVFQMSNEGVGRAGTHRMDLKIDMDSHSFDDIGGYFLVCKMPNALGTSSPEQPKILQIDVWEK